ncbi:MAG: cellulase family glycosylhydrolase [Thermoflexales bacterium]|nr:cellulase family glycosylhydrolase [Thermoflexales bacterium]
MQQFPSNQRQSVLDRIPTRLMVVGWLVALCVSAACLYWAIFGTGPAAQPGGAPTQVVRAQPTPTSAAAPQAATPAAPVQGGDAAAPVAPDQSQPAQPPTDTPKAKPTPSFGYGVQVNGLVGDAEATTQMAAKVGATWVKQQLRWGDFGHGPSAEEMDWSGFDPIINACAQYKIKVMLSIVTAPGWSRAMGTTHGPPDDLNQYAAFLGHVVDRYKGKIHAIEIWNEQNLDREWATNPQQLSAPRYVEMLKLAYQTIKAHDPNIIVISGALSPTGWDDGVQATDDFRYLEQMVAAGFLNYADCVGIHHNGYNIGPDVSSQTAMQHPKAASAHFKGPFESFQGGLPHHSWFFYDTLQGYAQRVGNKPLCVTEFGWASSQGYTEIPPGFEFALDNTLQEQSDYIVQAYSLMRQWGFVKMAFLWNLDYGNKGNGPTDDVVPYSLVDINGVPRPAFEALERMPKP